MQFNEERAVFQHMVLGQLDTHWQKYEHQPKTHFLYNN